MMTRQQIPFGWTEGQSPDHSGKFEYVDRHLYWAQVLRQDGKWIFRLSRINPDFRYEA